MTGTVMAGLVVLIELVVLAYLLFRLRLKKSGVVGTTTQATPVHPKGAVLPAFTLPKIETGFPAHRTEIRISAVLEYLQASPAAQGVFTWFSETATKVFRGDHASEMDTEMLGKLGKLVEEEPRRVFPERIWEFFSPADGAIISQELGFLTDEINARLAAITWSPEKPVPEKFWKAVVFSQALSRIQRRAGRRDSGFSNAHVSVDSLRLSLGMGERDLERLEMSASGARETIPEVVGLGETQKPAMEAFLEHLRKVVSQPPPPYSPSSDPEKEFRTAFEQLRAKTLRDAYSPEAKELIRRCRVSSIGLLGAQKSEESREALESLLREEMKPLIKTLEWGFSFASESRLDCYSRMAVRPPHPAKQALEYLAARLPLLEKFESHGALNPETLRTLMRLVESHLAFLEEKENLESLSAEDRKLAPQVVKSVRERLKQLYS